MYFTWSVQWYYFQNETPKRLSSITRHPFFTGIITKTIVYVRLSTWFLYFFILTSSLSHGKTWPTQRTKKLYNNYFLATFFLLHKLTRMCGIYCLNIYVKYNINDHKLIMFKDHVVFNVVAYAHHHKKVGHGFLIIKLENCIL